MSQKRMQSFKLRDNKSVSTPGQALEPLGFRGKPRGIIPRCFRRSLGNESALPFRSTLLENKYSLVPLIIATSLLIAVSFVRADDDKEEYDDKAPVETVAPAPSNTTAETASKPKTAKQTIIVEPEQIITSTVMKNITLADSDQDGIADEQDAYPDIPNYLIVSDSNLNGIDDSYEIQAAE